MFERFHRGRAGRAGPPGTGLGLPIARELMRRWGGDVTLANREGGGAAATTISLRRGLTTPLPTVTPMHAQLLWILGALAGVVLAAGVTYAASSLSTQRIGLSAEPAERRRGPRARAPPRRPRRRRRPQRTATPASSKRTPTPHRDATPAPTTVPVPTAAPTVDDDNSGSGSDDDSSGRGRGRGRGRRRRRPGSATGARLQSQSTRLRFY